MEKIETLDALVTAALNKKAVTINDQPYFGNRAPAAFIVNMQAIHVHRLIQSGMFIYEPVKKHLPTEPASDK